MKLRNKKTGEIGYLIVGRGSNHYVVANNEWDNCGEYNSLAELNEEWEDYEEPKGFWSISGDATIEHYDRLNENDCCKEIGNYFETKEEAERAVEKLKAWKRLKDKGLKIREYELNGGTDRNGCFTGNICLTLDITKPIYEDVIQLLFGGEE